MNKRWHIRNEFPPGMPKKRGGEISLLFILMYKYWDQREFAVT